MSNIVSCHENCVECENQCALYINMTNPLKNEIKTPEGVLKAEVINDENYPGIKITLNGDTVAVVEHYGNGIRTEAYQSDYEEPVEMIKYAEV